MRRLLCLSACAAFALVVGGCSSQTASSGTYTFSQQDGGNIAASDALGCNLALHDQVQTAFVPHTTAFVPTND
jgi:ABC-type uncharacterized transport system auxiliary subunit